MRTARTVVGRQRDDVMKAKRSAPSTRKRTRSHRLRKRHGKHLSKTRTGVKHQTQPTAAPLQDRETPSLPELPSESCTTHQSLPSGSLLQEGETSSSPPEGSSSFLAASSFVMSLDADIDTDAWSLESPHADIDDPDVPPLQRTDSIFLTKEYLDQMYKVPDNTEASDSCIESTDDDYIPSKDSTDESSSDGSDKPMGKVPSVKQRVSKPCRGKTLDSTPKDNDDRKAKSDNTDTNLEGVSVLKLQKKKDGGRLYNKPHYCLYCPIHCLKMARHLVRRHGDETAVAQAVAFPLNSKERKLHLDLIRNKGDQAHNNEVLKSGRGTLIPKYQSGKTAKVSDFMHCINCKAFLKRKSLWRHVSRCRLSQKCDTNKPGRSRIQSLCAFAQPAPDGVTNKVWELINGMHQDDITNIIKQQKSILRFGEYIYAKHGHDKTKHEYIRQKMREMGRLIQHAQKMGRLKRIEDFYVPSNFNFVIDAVKGVAGFDEERNLYKTPSLALKLGHSLKKIADILECEAQMAESDNEEFLKNLKRSRGLYEKKWDVCVSSRALQTLKEGKWNTPQLLPFTEDVKSMHTYLDKCRQEYQSRLKDDPNKKNWSKLANLTLCEVILFNRRREGEVSKMPLIAFTLRDSSEVHSDLALGLSEFEQKLCQHFERIEIRGKRDRKVPILLTPDMLSSMQVLVTHRRACGVPDENPFFFSRPESETHLRGSDAIRQIAKECGAKHPETLSSTKLRKHVSTLSTVLNLRDNEMDILANFLGHDIRVHRQYYRLPEGTLQLAKVSKVLIALEQGRLSDFKGMSLDQIQIDPNEEVPEARDSDLSDAGEDLSFSSSAGSSTSSSKRSLPSADEFGDVTPRGYSTPKKKKETESDSDCPATGSSTSTGRNEMDESDGDDPTPESSRPKKRQQGLLTLKRRPETAESDSSDLKAESSKRRHWSSAEVCAVEKTLMTFIQSGKVPGKSDCVRCIEASPGALRGRTWTAVIMPPTTPYAGKFNSYGNNNNHPQPHSPYRSGTAPKPAKENVYNGAYSSTENPYDIPQRHSSYRSSSVSSATTKEHHYTSGCAASENPYSSPQPHSPRQHSTSCPGRAYRHTSSSSGGSEQSSRNNSVTAKARLHGHGVTASYGEMCYHDNSLVSASLEALIQHLVPTVDYYPDRSYVFTFLLSSRLFLHPYELMTRVCHLCVEQQRSGDALLDKIRFREVAPKLVQLLTEWTETFPYDFRDERMMRCLKDMTHHVARGDEYSWRAMQQMTQRLIKRLSALGQYEEAVAALNTVAMERPASLKSKQASGQRSDIMSVCDDPFILAQQLTHIELDRLSFIGPEEFIQTFAMKDPLENHKGFFRKRKTSNLEAYVSWFNRLSYLVATEICMPVKKKHRARIIEFFIDVAQECFNIGNFNSLMAIITGMNMSPVARLRKTWSKVNTDKFEILEHQMDPSSNFSNYRTALRGATQRSETAHSSQEKIVIPFFSLLIKDIYFLNEGCASRLPNGHINFEKLWELAKQVSEFLVWRQVVCPFDRERRILQFLVTTPVFSEDELHLASYESEGPENNMEKDSRRSLRSSLLHRENRS